MMGCASRFCLRRLCRTCCRMRMWTQILVRTEVPPLSLLHAIGAQVTSVDADQQISGQVEDLEHWIIDQQE